MSFLNVLLGRPLATSEDRAQRVGLAAGIPIFGLDALTSSAYGPEAAMTLLIPLGIASINHIVPVITAILILMAIVYFSYRQTLEAYPSGGGSYTVASENLGNFAGMLAASALMIDYILTCAIGMSSGVTALTSAVPWLIPHRLTICLTILFVMTLINLRGVRDTGKTFILPTAMFIL
ncbi:MAG: APC family permease, partial [Acidobacteriaceae bacterium]|nr:APC family permease [Acidobacteriaceae bacterium]